MIEEIQVPDDIVELLCLSIWVNNMWVFFYMLLEPNPNQHSLFLGKGNWLVGGQEKEGFFTVFSFKNLNLSHVNYIVDIKLNYT